MPTKPTADPMLVAMTAPRRVCFFLFAGLTMLAATVEMQPLPAAHPCNGTLNESC